MPASGRPGGRPYPADTIPGQLTAADVSVLDLEEDTCASAALDWPCSPGCPSSSPPVVRRREHVAGRHRRAAVDGTVRRGVRLARGLGLGVGRDRSRTSRSASSPTSARSTTRTSTSTRTRAPSKARPPSVPIRPRSSSRRPTPDYAPLIQAFVDQDFDIIVTVGLQPRPGHRGRGQGQPGHLVHRRRPRPVHQRDGRRRSDLRRLLGRRRQAAPELHRDQLRRRTRRATSPASSPAWPPRPTSIGAIGGIVAVRPVHPLHPGLRARRQVGQSRTSTSRRPSSRTATSRSASTIRPPARRSATSSSPRTRASTSCSRSPA